MKLNRCQFRRLDSLELKAGIYWNDRGKTVEVKCQHRILCTIWGLNRNCLSLHPTHTTLGISSELWMGRRAGAKKKFQTRWLLVVFLLVEFFHSRFGREQDTTTIEEDRTTTLRVKREKLNFILEKLPENSIESYSWDGVGTIYNINMSIAGGCCCCCSCLFIRTECRLFVLRRSWCDSLQIKWSNESRKLYFSHYNHYPLYESHTEHETKKKLFILPIPLTKYFVLVINNKTQLMWHCTHIHVVHIERAEVGFQLWIRCEALFSPVVYIYVWSTESCVSNKCSKYQFHEAKVALAVSRFPI